MNEYEAALRRAFVDRRCDFIMIDSRRQEFQIKSANSELKFLRDTAQ